MRVAIKVLFDMTDGMLVYCFESMGVLSLLVVESETDLIGGLCGRTRQRVFFSV